MKDPKAPIWIDPVDTLLLNHQNLHFKTENLDWKAFLRTEIQPISIPWTYSHGILSLSLKDISGIVEGPADFSFIYKDKSYDYSFYLKNPSGIKLIHRDYRSPKDLNPDSNLEQQKIVHQIDIYRNLKELPNKDSLFEETWIQLKPKVATYRAIANLPLSSFYVQAGSAVNIPVQSKYNPIKEGYDIQIGPLKDRIGNLVSDGTLLSLDYGDGLFSYHLETTILEGYAHAFIFAKRKNKFTLQVKVNETASEIIRLNP